MRRYSKLLALILTLAVAVFMISSPQQSVDAAWRGLVLWAQVLVPALFPFFIIAEILVALGFVGFLGIMLEPIVRPLFRLPGAASLVIVMGFCAGFPMGAVLSRRLYEEKLLTQAEAERLCAFTNNSSPLFIIGAVGVGMFASPAVGYLLAACHYLSNLCVGILLRFTVAPAEALPAHRAQRRRVACRSLSGKVPVSLGELLSQAIKNSLSSILAVGGFVMLFSIVTALSRQWGLMEAMAQGIQALLAPFCLSLPLAHGISTGLFEISIGAQAISSSGAPLMWQIPALCAVMALGGLSILAQVIAVAATIPVRISYYLGCRLLQAILATGFSLIGLHLFAPQILPAASLSWPPLYQLLYTFDVWHIVGGSLLASLAVFAVLLVGAWFSETKTRPL